jgi:hypothetical protein
VTIVFLTGSLKPGADGVGDYTRQLAAELIRQGHACAMIALNDFEVTEVRREEQDRMVPALRIPAGASLPVKVKLARAFADEFGAEVFSWQFVSYAYHPRGLAGFMAELVAEIVGERPLHLMLHELWIGIDRGAGLKERITGFLQARQILALQKRLRPVAVQVSNPTYVELLARRGVTATALPLFGNIPITNETAEKWLFPRLEQDGCAVTTVRRGEFWLFGFFGSLHEVWPPEPLLTRVRAAARKHGRRAVFISIGRLGPGEGLWQRLADTAPDDVKFVKLGPRSSAEISQFLNTIDFGVATSPLGLIGKSGTAAAMLEHDLPVIVNREDERSGRADREPLEGFGRFIRLDDSFEQRLVEGRRREPGARLPNVATRFARALQDHVEASQRASSSLSSGTKRQVPRA